MSQPGDDDRDFAAFLAGDDELSAMLQQLPQPAPSAALDQAILAQAAAAVAGKAANDNAAVQAANDEQAGGVQPYRRSRWAAPLGVAASLLLTVGVAWHWMGGKPEAPVILAQEPVAEAQAPVPAAAPAAPAAADALKESATGGNAAAPQPVRKQQEAARQAPQLARAPAPKTGPESSGGHDVARKVQQAEADKHDKTEVAAAAVEPPVQLAAPVAPAAEQQAVGELKARRDAAPAPVLADRAAAGANSIHTEPAKAAAAPPAEARLRALSTTAKPAARQASAAEVPTAEEWLKQIDALLHDNQPQKAREEWQRFKQHYPDYPVDEAQRKRLDALPQ
ncbi:Meckel syndrome type 1 protein [Andreprevotia lacus DSM 23236]|jgi:hypothetical protein|uniref:Meckel syndrome type 1 protein n=1 Tax=Andreprevotia lacus DSM 23236 TaxID=1121001 RepID=A0A1W1XG58_9NEIS|nr:hypothetical protein [Andreprevotia lacus]SMC22782.1 Meckel syndrome type 1 protein [Andreprevotia lacus DSM 23236]